MVLLIEDTIEAYYPKRIGLRVEIVIVLGKNMAGSSRGQEEEI